MNQQEVNLEAVLKTSFTSIFKDPGYILLYVIPVITSIVFTLASWLIIGTDINSLSSQLTDTSALSSFIQTKLIPFIVLIVIYAIMYIIVTMTVLAALIKKVEAQERGTRLSVSESLSSGFSYFPRLLAATIVLAIVFGLPIAGLIALMVFGAVSGVFPLLCISSIILIILIIPLIYFGLRISLFAQTCVLEDIGAIESIKRSWRITKGNVMIIFVVGFIIAIIGFIITIPFTAASMLLSLNTYFTSGFETTTTGPNIQIINSIGNWIVQAIISPISGIALTLIYLGLTKKKERESYSETNY